MKRNTLTFLVALVILVVVDIYLGQTQPALRLWTKPLLIPAIMVFYIGSVGFQSAFSRRFILALFFSWLGDILLMFEDRNDLYFILGLSSFLTAHILYILYFAGIRSDTQSFFRKRPVMFIAVVAYVIELLYLLWPQLGHLKVPVLVYALVIGTMLAMALWQYGKLPRNTALLFIFGAMLFVLSDSALALNRFYQSHPASGILVMSTYVAAQTCLALGSIAHIRSLESLPASPEDKI